ncbi:hypothetical protein AB1Y20_004215 [Prymnesium parvum]|uniref:non-specific serine/threonine protein kinase n=1 Tax=Prymnesium parvum TaxID=97485 RepID=A0AB34J9D0_PRYPA
MIPVPAALAPSASGGHPAHAAHALPLPAAPPTASGAHAASVAGLPLPPAASPSPGAAAGVGPPQLSATAPPPNALADDALPRQHPPSPPPATPPSGPHATVVSQPLAPPPPPRCPPPPPAAAPAPPSPSPSSSASCPLGVLHPAVFFGYLPHYSARHTASPYVAVAPPFACAVFCHSSAPPPPPAPLVRSPLLLLSLARLAVPRLRLFAFLAVGLAAPSPPAPPHDRPPLKPGPSSLPPPRGPHRYATRSAPGPAQPPHFEPSSPDDRKRPRTRLRARALGPWAAAGVAGAVAASTALPPAPPSGVVASSVPAPTCPPPNPPARAVIGVATPTAPAPSPPSSDLEGLCASAARCGPSDFERLRVLSQTHGSTTRLVRRRVDGVLLCVKERSQPAAALHEVEMLARLHRHPQCLGFEGAYLHAGRLCIVLEFAPHGTLAAQIERRRTRGDALAEAEVLDVLVQLGGALAHLHRRGIVHRDLKPSNLFLDARRLVRLADFSIAACIADGPPPRKSKFLGTPLYVAPEIIEDRPVSFKTDIWALGVITYEMIALRPPFAAENLIALGLAITSGRYEPLSAAVAGRQASATASGSDGYSEELLSLPSRMLCLEADDRPDATALLAMPIVSRHAVVFRHSIERWKECADRVSDEVVSGGAAVASSAGGDAAAAAWGDRGAHRLTRESLERWEARMALLLVQQQLSHLHASIAGQLQSAREAALHERGARETALLRELREMEAEGPRGAAGGDAGVRRQLREAEELLRARDAQVVMLKSMKKREEQRRCVAAADTRAVRSTFSAWRGVVIDARVQRLLAARDEQLGALSTRMQQLCSPASAERAHSSPTPTGHPTNAHVEHLYVATRPTPSAFGLRPRSLPFSQKARHAPPTPPAPPPSSVVPPSRRTLPHSPSQKRGEGMVLFERESTKSAEGSGVSPAVDMHHPANHSAAGRGKRGELRPQSAEAAPSGAYPYVSPGGLYERGLKQRAKREAAMARRKREKDDQELRDCTFEPNRRGEHDEHKEERDKETRGAPERHARQKGLEARASREEARASREEAALDVPRPATAVLLDTSPGSSPSPSPTPVVTTFTTIISALPKVLDTYRERRHSRFTSRASSPARPSSASIPHRGSPSDPTGVAVESVSPTEEPQTHQHAPTDLHSLL